MTFGKDTAREPSLSLMRAARAVGLACAVLALAGCKHMDQGTQVAGWSLVDPIQRHPILVSEEPSILSLHVGRGSDGLNPHQRAEVLEFGHHFKASDAGNSRIVVSVPSGSGNEVAAMGVAGDVRELLVDSGFSESTVVVESYHSGAASPPVKISYMRYVARGPDCGHDWSENLARDSNNAGYPNFGCTNQKNLAAMIVNPGDLLAPRTMGDRYADRRDAVMNAWVQGKTTGSEKSQDERVNVKDSQ